MDYAQLRDLLEPPITGLKDAGTRTTLLTLCEELGLPAPAADGSKRERMTSSFDAVADAELPAVARKRLVRHPPNAITRNQIQDILWSNNPSLRLQSHLADKTSPRFRRHGPWLMGVRGVDSPRRLPCGMGPGGPLLAVRYSFGERRSVISTGLSGHGDGLADRNDWNAHSGRALAAVLLRMGQDRASDVAGPDVNLSHRSG